MNDISDRTKRDPANFLAIGSTSMANERTLLAFIRTSMTFVIMGIGMIKYLAHPVFDAIGWICVVIAGILLIWGVYRYRRVRKGLREITPEDLQASEKEMGL